MIWLRWQAACALIPRPGSSLCQSDALYDSYLPCSLSRQVESSTEAPRIVCRSRRTNIDAQVITDYLVIIRSMFQNAFSPDRAALGDNVGGTYSRLTWTKSCIIYLFVNLAYLFIALDILLCRGSLLSNVDARGPRHPATQTADIFHREPNVTGLDLITGTLMKTFGTQAVLVPLRDVA